jgi:hypothetical protein
MASSGRWVTSILWAAYASSHVETPANIKCTAKEAYATYVIVVFNITR